MNIRSNTRKKSQALLIRLHPDKKAELDKVSEKFGMPRSELIRIGINWALEQADSGVIQIKTLK